MISVGAGDEKADQPSWAPPTHRDGARSLKNERDLADD
jgi:hypothetical protein